jgi:hypothetical protein
MEEGASIALRAPSLFNQLIIKKLYILLSAILGQKHKFWTDLAEDALQQ